MAVRFTINNQDFELPELFFNKIGEIKNKEIPNSLASKGQYVIQSKVSTDAFQLLLNYLLQGQPIEVHFDNFYELSLLNQEFQISYLADLLSNTKQEWRKYEEVVKNLKNAGIDQNIGPQANMEEIRSIFLSFQNKLNDFRSTCLDNESRIKYLEEEIKNFESSVSTDISKIKDEIQKNDEELRQLISDNSLEHAEQIGSKFNDLTQKNEEMTDLLNEFNSNLQNIQQSINQLQNNFDMHKGEEIFLVTNSFFCNFNWR